MSFMFFLLLLLLFLLHATNGTFFVYGARWLKRRQLFYSMEFHNINFYFRFFAFGSNISSTPVLLAELYSFAYIRFLIGLDSKRIYTHSPTNIYMYISLHCSSFSPTTENNQKKKEKTPSIYFEHDHDSITWVFRQRERKLSTFCCNSKHTLFFYLSHENANFASFLLMIVNWVPFFSLLSRLAVVVGVYCRRKRSGCSQCVRAYVYVH